MTDPVGQRWDAPQRRDFDVPESATLLTHLGRRRADGTIYFREEPAWRIGKSERWVEVDVSMLEGELDIADAVRLIRRRPPTPREQKQDVVRYFRAGTLHEAGYFVVRTPTRGIPNHVSVYGNLDAISAYAHTDLAAALIDQAANRWWWAKPDRVRLESLELARRYPK